MVGLGKRSRTVGTAKRVLSVVPASFAMSMHARMDMGSDVATMAEVGVWFRRALGEVEQLRRGLQDAPLARLVHHAGRVAVGRILQGPGRLVGDVSGVGGAGSETAGRVTAGHLGGGGGGVAAGHLDGGVAGRAARRWGAQSGSGVQLEQPTDRGGKVVGQRAHELGQLVEGCAGDAIVDGHEVSPRGGAGSG